jgi:hypothetical protein
MIETIILLFIFVFVFDIYARAKSLSDFDEAVSKEIDEYDKTGEDKSYDELKVIIHTTTK